MKISNPHDGRRPRFLDVLGQDLRYGTRPLLRTPRFSAIVVLTLGLALAAGQLLAAQLFGVEPADPVTLIAVVGLFGAVAHDGTLMGVSTMATRAATHLMFEGDASAALDLYDDVFPGFRIDHIERYADGEQGPAGTIKRADASLYGHDLILIDSPVHHEFTFTPAVSLFVDCESADELEAAFAALSRDGAVFMPLDDYGFSRRFGWCGDRFGVSWQLNLP